MHRIVTFVLAFSALAGAADWRIVWQDEFDGKAGSLPDSSKWSYDLGGGGWGNNELEVYTNAAENAQLDGNGHLVIRAIKTGNGGYTSARLRTEGKLSATYGKFEVRMKIPFGEGMWPAFWLLGNDIRQVSWPACGEFDVMENVGREPTIVHGTVHGPGYSGGAGISKALDLKVPVNADFHVFTAIWDPESIEFLVDGKSYHRVTPASLPSGTKWVFNKPFFLLLNLAVGGTWPGNPTAATQFPQDLIVDWVRVSSRTTDAAIYSGGVVNSASYQPALAPGALATLFGLNLGEGTTVSVNGVNAPLVFLSQAQINFQIPWSTPVNQDVEVRVTRDGITSDAQLIRLGYVAPAVFTSAGKAIVSCADSRNCTLWGNGFGQKTVPQQDGKAAGDSPLPYAVEDCHLRIGATDAVVTYCGAAPGLLIDQLNFVVPSGLSTATNARLTIDQETVDFQLPPLP